MERRIVTVSRCICARLCPNQRPAQPAAERTDDSHVGLILDGDRVVGIEHKPDRKPDS
jgi:hypothetical protein